eukprot:7586016-Pyramimonas_sp.AAC.1
MDQWTTGLRDSRGVKIRKPIEIMAKPASHTYTMREETVHGPSSTRLGLQQGIGQGCPIHSEDAAPLRRSSSNCSRHAPREPRSFL